MSILISMVSSSSGITSQDANDVCLLPDESKGDILTRRCTPSSDLRNPYAFSPDIITEQLFGLTGIGQASYQSMVAGDIPFTMFYLMFISVLTLVGNLVADLCYAAADPRVRLS